MSWIKRHSFAFTAIGAIVIAALVGMLPSYYLFQVGQLSLVISVSVALTVLMGGAGLLALSSPAFLAVGAYGVIILMVTLGVPLVLAAPLAVMVGGALGGLLGFVTLRLSGFYLAIATLGLLQVLLVGLKFGGALTGGGYGLVAPAIPHVNAGRVAIAAVFLGVLVIGVSVNLMRSRIGRAWLASRDNEPAAQMQGIDVPRMKVTAFVYSSAIVSLAGVLHALLLGVTNPSTYSMHLSVFHITLVVVGGMTGSIVGAVIAPMILYFIPEMFSAIGEWRDFYYGSILLLTLWWI